jgi:hypothetical protein
MRQVRTLPAQAARQAAPRVQPVLIHSGRTERGPDRVQVLHRRCLVAGDADPVGVDLAQVDPARRRARDHLRRPAGHHRLEGVEEGLVGKLHARAAQAGREQGGQPVRPGGDAAQAVGTVVDRVHARHHREQHLRGADVAGRLLPPDVLLARLQRESVGRLSVGVPAEAHEPPGHGPLQASAHREVAGVRTAETHGYAEALRAADRHVRANLARRTQQAQRQQVGCDGDDRATLVRGRHQRGVVAHGARRTRVLQVQPEELLRQRLARVNHPHLDAERLGPRHDH